MVKLFVLDTMSICSISHKSQSCIKMQNLVSSTTSLENLVHHSVDLLTVNYEIILKLVFILMIYV